MWWIKASIQEFILRSWSLVKMGTTAYQKKLFFNLRRMKKNLSWLTAAETAAMARDLGVSPAEVTEMEQRLSARDLSFDPTPEGDEEDSYGPAQYLPAADADPAESTATEQWDGDVTRRLSEAVGRLDARSQDIVRRRWIAEDKSTLHELAAEYKVSAERVRQIEVAAMKRLKQLLGNDAEMIA
jgi:RNA polymerase sigma-32 factor